MADGPSTLADCLATSCGPISNPAKNGALPMDTVPQKARKTTPAFGCACKTATKAKEIDTALWATMLAAGLSSLWLAMTWHPGSQ